MNDEQLTHQLIHQYIIPDAQSWRMNEDRRIERVCDMAALALVHFRVGRKIQHKPLYSAIGVSRNTWMKTWAERHFNYVNGLRSIDLQYRNSIL